jgi:hypothetical protein
MLDNIERRRFLEQPARKISAPFIIAAMYDHLDERAGIMFGFPGRSRFTGFQSHDKIADANRLTWLHREIAIETVALVEYPQRRNALGHRSDLSGESDGL